MTYLMQYQSPVGILTIASDGKHITGLWIREQKYFAYTIADEPVMMADKSLVSEQVSVLRHAKEWLDRYFSGEKPSPKELPLLPAGGEFRRHVWEILCGIPYGEVTTYGEIARRIAAEQGLKTMSAQAVGGAVGHNPIGIIIPCHRVIGSNGSLTGYAGGLDVKRKLLRMEGADRFIR